MMIARVAAAALPVAVVTLAAAALAVFGAWMRWLPPLAGLGVFTLALAGGGLLSFVLGTVAWWTSAGAENVSRQGPIVAVAVGLGCLIVLFALAAGGADAPRIHDISTDLEDPPVFVAAAADPANRGRDLSYPNGAPDTPELQRQAYPDIEPMVAETADPDVAYREALEAAERLGWRIVARDEEGRTFEAEDETGVFRFVDDIVVRVRPLAGGAVIDVRSLSRLGVGDLGVNVARIREFRTAMGGA